MKKMYAYFSTEELLEDFKKWFDLLFEEVRREKENRGRGEDGEDKEYKEDVGEKQRKEIYVKMQNFFIRCEQDEGNANLLICRIMQEYMPSELDKFAFLLALLPEISQRYKRIYQYLQGDMEKGNLTAGLVYELYRWCAPGQMEDLYLLSDMNRPFNKLFFRQSMDSRRTGLYQELYLRGFIPFMLQGLLQISEESKNYIEVTWAYENIKKLPCHREIIERISKILKTGTQDSHTLIHIYGSLSNGMEDIIKTSAHQAGYGSMKIFLERMPDRLEEVSCLVEDMVSQCRLYHLIPYFYIEESGEEKENIKSLEAVISKILESLEYVVCMTSSQNLNLGKKEIFNHGRLLQIEVPNLSLAERKIGWEFYLEGKSLAEGLDSAILAGQYRLGLSSIRNVIDQAWESARYKGHSSIGQQDLQQAIGAQAASGLSKLAVRIEPSYTWEDIKLYPQARQMLIQACNRLKYKYVVDAKWGFDEKVAYGKGISILMYGPPGTGKTMAAQIMAKELGLFVYRVDLGTVVSKYIGETEKNLGKIFDEARDSNVILFFDEADSLFSKRTDIQTSNDKHANSETAFILQKIEEYSGMCILATNRFQNIDEAFLRRITYAVHFDRPDAGMRLELWKSIMPERVPLEEDVDLSFFAKQFELSGSSIKAIILDAAYGAAADGGSLGVKHIVNAIRTEYRKMGKILDAAEFGDYSYYALADFAIAGSAVTGSAIAGSAMIDGGLR